MVRQKSKSKQASAKMTEKLDAAATLVRIMCPYPDIKHFTETELEALHVFKFEVVTSTHRLFTQVSKKKATPIVKKVVREWADSLED